MPWLSRQLAEGIGADRSMVVRRPTTAPAWTTASCCRNARPAVRAAGRLRAVDGDGRHGQRALGTHRPGRHRLAPPRWGTRDRRLPPRPRQALRVPEPPPAGLCSRLRNRPRASRGDPARLAGLALLRPRPVLDSWDAHEACSACWNQSFRRDANLAQTGTGFGLACRLRRRAALPNAVNCRDRCGVYQFAAGRRRIEMADRSKGARKAGADR
jgi:hypothetical protein